MSREIEKELRDAVLQGLKMQQEVRVHPDWLAHSPTGTVTGWSMGIYGHEVEVRVGEGEYIDVPREALISVEMYDAFHAWGRSRVKA